MRRIVYIILTSALSLLTVSCFTDSEYEDVMVGLSGEKYTGALTVGNVSAQEDVIFYVAEGDDVVDILMPGVSFLPGLMPNLDMALIDTPLVSSDPATYRLSSSQMVVIYDRTPLINDVLQAISDIEIERDGDSVTVDFVCSISISMGDMDVNVNFVGEKM